MTPEDRITALPEGSHPFGGVIGSGQAGLDGTQGGDAGRLTLVDVAQRRGLGRLDGQRRTLADDPGDLDCPVEFRAGGDHLLHEADPVRLGGIEQPPRI